jgi:hypothetical protein
MKCQCKHLMQNHTLKDYQIPRIEEHLRRCQKMGSKRGCHEELGEPPYDLIGECPCRKEY